MGKVYLKKVKAVRKTCHDKNNRLCFFIDDSMNDCSNKPQKLNGICTKENIVFIQVFPENKIENKEG